MEKMTDRTFIVFVWVLSGPPLRPNLQTTSLAVPGFVGKENTVPKS